MLMFPANQRFLPRSLTDGLAWLCTELLGKKAIAIWVSFVFLLTASLAHANSPPPISVGWFDLSPSANIDSLQVVVCESETCANPNALATYGSCSAEDCLPQAEPNLFLECRRNTCLMSDSLFLADCPYITEHFRVLVQVGDRTWVSPVRSEAPIQEVSTLSWQMTVVNDSLQVRQRPRRTTMQALGRLIWSLGFTLIPESIVVGIYLWTHHCSRSVWIRTLFTVGLIHLVTLPFLWSALEITQPFVSQVSQNFIWVTSAIALIYASILVIARKISLGWLTAITILILPLCFTVGLIGAAIFGGRQLPLQTALPYWPTLLIVELIIVLYEMILLTTLSRGQWTWKTTSQMSLIMNTVSVLAGLGLGPLLWRFLVIS